MLDDCDPGDCCCKVSVRCEYSEACDCELEVMEVIKEDALCFEMPDCDDAGLRCKYQAKPSWAGFGCAVPPVPPLPVKITIRPACESQGSVIFACPDGKHPGGGTVTVTVFCSECLLFE